MGLLAGLAGALLASRLNTAVVLAGEGVELKVITAVVLGGASLAGGVGTIPGAFLGVMFMALVQNAMIIAGINPFWQLIVVGIVLLVAIGLDLSARSAVVLTRSGRGAPAGSPESTRGRWTGMRETGGNHERGVSHSLSRHRARDRRAARRAQGAHRARRAVGDPSRADQEYVWISNASNLPLFVERVYPGLEVGAQGAQRQGPHRRPDLGRPRAPSSRPSTPNAPRTRPA